MSYTRTVKPAIEPVTLAEAKLHLRVDISDDDNLISSLITVAREYVEEVTGRALITQTWRYSLNNFFSNWLKLPRPPLQSVTSVIYTDGSNVTATVASSVYGVDTDSEPGIIRLAYNQSWPTVATLATINPIKITYVAGYGSTAADVPQKYRQAILLLIGHWYENRESVISTGAVPKEIPLAVDSLLTIDRIFS